MDQHPKTYTDAEIEFLLMKKAVEEALNDTRPDVPNDEVVAMMERELAEIEQEIVARPAE
jgi:hypothetical protein